MGTMKRLSTHVVALATVVMTFPAVARAEAPTANEDAAQRLFDEARQLIVDHRWSEACPRLARSHQLDPRPTTLFRLAECLEHTGKLASARDAYLGAASAAATAGESRRAEFANERATRLERSVARLVITVSERPATVTKDGEPFDESKWGARIPVDAGDHVVVAEAPGKQRYTARVYVTDGALTVLTIPPLLALPPTVAAPASGENERRPVTPAPPGATAAVDNPGLRRWSAGFVGLGLASAGVGGTLVLTADENKEGCRGSCAVGTGLLVGGALFAAMGVAFFFASFGDGSGPARASKARPFELRF